MLCTDRQTESCVTFNVIWQTLHASHEYIWLCLQCVKSKYTIIPFTFLYQKSNKTPKQLKFCVTLYSVMLLWNLEYISIASKSHLEIMWIKHDIIFLQTLCCVFSSVLFHSRSPEAFVKIDHLFYYRPASQHKTRMEAALDFKSPASSIYSSCNVDNSCHSLSHCTNFAVSAIYLL